MRTGPKWMALFGVVFAVGAGSAPAQITVSAPRTVDEGRQFTFDVIVDYRKAAGSNVVNGIDLTITAEPGSSGDVSNVGRVNGLTAAEPNDYSAPTLAVLAVFGNTGTAAVIDTTRTRRDVRLRSDEDAEDEELRLTFALAGSSNLTGLVGQDGQPLTAPDPVVIRIEDAQEQTFKWETPTGADDTSPKEGTAATRTLKADPAPENMVWNVALFTEEAGYSLSPAVTTLTSGNPTRGISITPPDNDGDREDDTIELGAFLGGPASRCPGSTSRSRSRSRTSTRCPKPTTSRRRRTKTGRATPSA